MPLSQAAASSLLVLVTAIVLPLVVSERIFSQNMLLHAADHRPELEKGRAEARTRAIVEAYQKLSQAL